MCGGGRGGGANVHLRTSSQALFAASFKAMERSFGFTPAKLGVLQMWQSLSFSLSLPVWGVFLPALGAFPVCMCVRVCVRACVHGPRIQFRVHACACARKRGGGHGREQSCTSLILLAISSPCRRSAPSPRGRPSKRARWCGVACCESRKSGKEGSRARQGG